MLLSWCFQTDLELINEAAIRDQPVADAVSSLGTLVAFAESSARDRNATARGFRSGTAVWHAPPFSEGWP